MPSAFKSQPLTNLNLGVDLRSLTGGLTMLPGTASDAVDVLPREDGAVYKHPGWLRINTSSLTGRPLAIKGFSYKGKNNDAGGGETARPGNYGISDDSGPGDFTRRTLSYSGVVVLTDSTFYRWDAASESFASVSLPGGVSVDPHPKPSIIVYNNNLYIAGWADSNLRYDPTDEVLYLWGWESAPSAPSVSAGSSGGDLIDGGVYKYAYTWWDIYTGEETPLGTSASFTATSSGKADVTVTDYSGSRHFNDLATGADTDVGVVIYRTDADNETFNFLTTITPDLFSGGSYTYTDTGIATDTSLQPSLESVRDEPRYDAIALFQDQFYAITSLSTDIENKQPVNANRLWFNDFSRENSFVERWLPDGYRELPVPEGEVMTGLVEMDNLLLVFTEDGAYRVTVNPMADGSVDRNVDRMPWGVGCVGPKACRLIDGWVYFLSKRGPHRWRPGLADPEWIGRPVASIFLDVTSGLCKLTPGLRRESEVIFDPDTDMVRWAFPIGSTTVLNTHLMYWASADEFLPHYYLGWYFASPRAQCFDYTMGLIGTEPSGAPPNPETKVSRIAFGDDDGYINVYFQSARRAGLPTGSLASGTIQSGTLAVPVLTTAANPLLTQDDGLKGMRFEIKYASNDEIEVRRILSNTTTAVTLDMPLSGPLAAGDSWWVAGIPSFWRSWVDTMGFPHNRKAVLSLQLTYMLKDPDGSLLDVVVLTGDRTMDDLRRARTTSLADWNEKLLIAQSGLYFAYEVSNSRPDEMWVLNALEVEARVRRHKRKE